MIDKETFLKLGTKPNDTLDAGFNMGILALKIAGKKNGVSKLHGAVSKWYYILRNLALKRCSSKAERRAIWHSVKKPILKKL